MLSQNVKNGIGGFLRAVNDENLKNTRRMKAVQEEVQRCESYIKSRDEEIHRRNAEAKKLDDLLRMAGEGVTEDIAKAMKHAFDEVQTFGGVGSFVSQVATHNARTRQMKASVAETYRKTLHKHGLTVGVYVVKWTELVDWFTQTALGDTHSFVWLMGDCELEKDNGDACPEKLHLRLAIRDHCEVNELYVDPEMAHNMTRVECNNATKLCKLVFDNENMKRLHHSDGPGVTFETYVSNIMEDSKRLVVANVPDTYGVLNSMTLSATGKRGGRVDCADAERKKKPRTDNDATSEADAFAAAVLSGMS